MKYLKVFTDFLQDMEPLSFEERGRLFTAMLQYADDGTQTELTGNERFLWCLAKRYIDTQEETYQKLCERNRKNGSGSQSEPVAPIGSQSEPVATTGNKTKTKAKTNKEIISNEITKKFVPPTIDEVKAYVLSTGLHMDAEDFYDYYSSKHWKTSNGKEPMKDWQLTARRWARREKNFHGNAPQSSQYKNEDLERLEVKLV